MPRRLAAPSQLADAAASAGVALFELGEVVVGSMRGAEIGVGVGVGVVAVAAVVAELVVAIRTVGVTARVDDLTVGRYGAAGGGIVAELRAVRRAVNDVPRNASACSRLLCLAARSVSACSRLVCRAARSALFARSSSAACAAALPAGSLDCLGSGGVDVEAASCDARCDSSLPLLSADALAARLRLARAIAISVARSVASRRCKVVRVREVACEYPRCTCETLVVPRLA